MYRTILNFKMSSSESGSNSSSGEWLRFFHDVGLPRDVMMVYAAAFVENRIERSMLKELNKDMLQDMGIKPIGDIILILRHIRDICSEEVLEKVSAGAGSSSVNVAKVRPQTSVTVGKEAVPSAETGAEQLGSAVPNTRELRKVPRKNISRVLLQKNQKAQSNVEMQGSSGLSLRRTNAVKEANVGKSIPSSTLKSTSTGRGVHLKLRQGRSVRTLPTVAGDLVDMEGEEQNIENSVTLRDEQKSSAIPKFKLANKGGKKSVLACRGVGEGSSAVITGSVGKQPVKSILKKTNQPLQVENMRNGQVMAAIGRSKALRNCGLRTKSVESKVSVLNADGPNVARTIAIRSRSICGGKLAAHSLDKKQCIVRKPVKLPVSVDDMDDTESVADEESPAASGHVQQSNDITETSAVQDMPVGVKVGGLASHSVSEETATANATMPMGQNNLWSIKYGIEQEEVPVRRVQNIPTGYEGGCKIIMRRGARQVALRRSTNICSGRLASQSDENYDSLVDVGQGEEVDYLYNEELEDGQPEEEEEGEEEELEESEEEELEEDEFNENYYSGRNFEAPYEGVGQSVFDRLGWTYQENELQQRRLTGGGRTYHSVHHYRNCKQPRSSVFSRLGFFNPRRIYRQTNQRKNFGGICKPMYTAFKKNSGNQLNSNEVAVNKELDVLPRFVKNKKRLNASAESSTIEAPAVPSKKTVRFGTKEELSFSSEKEAVPKTIRKPLPGCITLKTGIFSKLGT